MVQKKKVSKTIALLGAAGMALSLFFSPAAGLPAHASDAGEDLIQPYRDEISYRYAVFDNKMYKRLFNYSTSNWIGDWIYVCDVPEGYPGKGESDGTKHERP